MSSPLAKRLAKLEGARQHAQSERYHAVWDRPDMTPEEQLAEMVAAGKASPNDHVMVHVFYEPSPDGPVRVYLPEPEGFGTWR